MIVLTGPVLTLRVVGMLPATLSKVMPTLPGLSLGVSRRFDSGLCTTQTPHLTRYLLAWIIMLLPPVKVNRKRFETQT